MPGKIFISYRREDSAGHAGRVHDRLQNEFSSDLVFMDVDAVPLGANFLKVLQDAVANCDVLLAVIGPSWLHACDREGKRRLENPNDYVRIEIAAALERDIPVIPILIDRTQIPPLEELPDDIRSLALRNGLDVRHGSFHADMGKLVKVLRGLVAVQREQASARMFGGTATAKEPRPSLPVALARRIAGARVLWVDDHPENNDYEQRVLESLGIDFVRSLDTEDALDNLQREQFDLIISDMGRPSGTNAGLDLLHRVRSGRNDTPLIFYTATPAVDDLDRLGAQGATDNVQELFHLVLSGLIERQIGQRAAAPFETSASGEDRSVHDDDRERTRMARPARELTRMVGSGRELTRRVGSDRADMRGMSQTSEPVADRFARPADEAQADPVVGWLVIVEGPGRGRSFQVFSGLNTIGRGPDQRICIDVGDGSIGQAQAQIVYDYKNRKFYILPGTGTKLTYVGEKVVLGQTELNPGDLLDMGQTKLRFVALCGSDFSWDD